MGSSSSKAARGAARKFPTRAPGAAVPPAAAPRPRAEARAPAHDVKDEAIKTDGQDPDDIISGDFSRRLQKMGIVDPNPTYSATSTASFPSSDGPSQPLGAPAFPSARQNTTLSVLEARSQLERQAEEDFEAVGRGAGRRFLDMRTMVEAMQLRDRGFPNGDIETRLRLQPGILAKLGRPSLLTHRSPGQ